MMRLCYSCVLNHCMARGQAMVGNSVAYGTCEGCGRVKSLYKAQGLSFNGRDIERALGSASAAVTPLPEPRRLPRSTAGFGWSIVLMAAALALAIGLLSRCAHGAPAKVSLDEWCQQAIRKLPTYYEDVPPGGVAGRTTEKEAQLTAIAQEVARVSRRAPYAPRKWAAVLLTIAWHESTLSLRIHAGQCKPWECDAGKARGIFQLHRSAANAPQWDRMHGREFTAEQVTAADQLLRRLTRTCGDGVEGTFEAYMGKRCGSGDPKVRARMETFGRLRP